MRGFGRIYRRRATWWVEYWHRGRQFRESSGSVRETDAERLLKRRLQEIGRGRFIGPSEERVLFTELLDGLLGDYKLNGRRSLGTVQYYVAALRSAFSGERAIDVTEDRIARYTRARLAEGYAPATINRELAALRRAFRLAVRQKRLSAAPMVTLLAEHNVRQGFVEPATFEAIAGYLPAVIRDLARFAYLSGWRKGEVATLEWTDVDRLHGLVILRREHSKNEEPRLLPLTPALAAIIERRWQARTVARLDKTSQLAEHVFHRAGRPIKSFRRTWAAACQAAGVPGVLFHDLRRSAVRNFERAGVSQAVAMKLSGHKTPSIYRRYRIVDESDLREALAKTELALADDQARVVVSLAAAREGHR